MKTATQTMTEAPLGAVPLDDGVRFRVWAPRAHKVDLVLEVDGRTVPLEDLGDGYYEVFVPGLEEGALYRYRLNDGPIYPDPYSRFQPQGVHGPSMIVDARQFEWTDQEWKGIPQKDLVFYELHVGTFSPEGTFEGMRDRLPHLKDLGITVIELMPVADWPGRWNWGYDHAALFAPSRAYGTPDDLRALVDAAHGMGLAVTLDVIYNHLGPDGAYIAAFAPMFTEKHHTAWGPGINLDDEGSEGVRRLFIQNALYWLEEFHFDGLRLDATDTLKDDSPVHFLRELSAAVAEIEEGPRRYLIAEDHRNLNTVLLPHSEGGYGLDGVWADNFHHIIRNMTAGDEEGYFADFINSTMTEVAITINQGWFYDHERVAPTRVQPHGTSAEPIRPDQCVFCIQNHDQIGNRAQGDRISNDVPLPVFRAISALLLFVPELPLIFMGEAWAANTPFQFFTDHEPNLGKLVTEGRRREFEHFTSFMGEVPDPQDERTFLRSKLDWQELEFPDHAGILCLYQHLLKLRPTLDVNFHAEATGEYELTLRRGDKHLLVSAAKNRTIPLPPGTRPVWHTELPEYAPDGHPPEVRDGHVYFPVAAALIAEPLEDLRDNESTSV
ncbi:MAG TPA: malto-oligosyltrehalose trehalohydrolase [Rhodothermales bacterium]|nr:malto-oligosyltrehalose trehalohydrolase [Rhodothermales bacterium]